MWNEHFVLRSTNTIKARRHQSENLKIKFIFNLQFELQNKLNVEELYRANKHQNKSKSKTYQL